MHETRWLILVELHTLLQSCRISCVVVLYNVQCTMMLHTSFNKSRIPAQVTGGLCVVIRPVNFKLSKSLIRSYMKLKCMFRGNMVALTAGVPGYGVLGVCRKLGVWKTRDLSRKRVVDKGKKFGVYVESTVFSPKWGMSVVSPTSRFAYIEVVSPTRPSRFAYTIWADSPTLKSFRLHSKVEIFCGDGWTSLPAVSWGVVFDRISS